MGRPTEPKVGGFVRITIRLSAAAAKAKECQLAYNR